MNTLPIETAYRFTEKGNDLAGFYVGWRVGRDFTNDGDVSARPSLSSQRILGEEPFHESEQLITEKYGNKIRWPEHQGPVLRNISPQIR